MKTLFQPGNTLLIKSVDYDHRAGKMLIDMGLTPNTVITIENAAPLGEPLIVRARNYVLALRRNDLAALNVEPLDEREPVAAGRG